MPKEPIQMTAKGLEKIKEELRYLKEEKRQELSDYMGAALADGDLRESAAYDEARLLQSANEARISDLEELVHRAVVVEHEGHLYGLLVDGADDIVAARDDVAPLGADPGPGWQMAALGRVETEAGAVLLLDVGALIAGLGQSLAA